MQLHRTQRITIYNILRCKVLYCYTLVVVAIGGEHLYCHESVLGAICGSLYYHEVDYAIGGVLYCHAARMVVIGGTFYYHQNI